MVMDTFQDIRPYNDSEVEGAIAQLLSDKAFMGLAQKFASQGEASLSLLGAIMECKTIYDFKKKVSHKIAQYVADKTTLSLSLSGKSSIDKEKASCYISNHRDIVLDSAFLNLLLSDAGYDFPRIAIGDNLFAFPWIERLVKLNDSFAVRRNLPMKELLQAADHLSDYVQYCLHEENKSVWIAQREGRAKDCNDRTQISVIKMLSRQPSSSGSLLEKIIGLNIVPLSISYEYDPCDYLKARETVLKQRNDGAYTKQQGEDVTNMRQGIMGHKGRVHFALGAPINRRIEQNGLDLAKNQLVAQVAQWIDEEVFLHYHLYPCNYVAFDWLNHSDKYAKMYSDRERKSFEEYITQRIRLALAVDPEKLSEASEIQLLQKGLPELEVSDYTQEIQKALLIQYAYPLMNYTEALENKQ